MANTYTLRGAAPAASLDVDTRAAFIVRTYQHLLGAILAFIGLEVLLFTSGLALRISAAMRGVSWLWFLGAFIVVSWLATRAAHRAVSQGAQYAALGALVVAWSLIFVPLLDTAQAVAPGVIESAALVTLIGAGGLTLVAFITRKDFSFLRALTHWGMVIALVVIVAGAIFSFRLGTFFSVAMIGLAGSAILYDTSEVLRRYPKDRHVAAALELFASVALMFWYVLRLFTSLSRN